MLPITTREAVNKQIALLLDSCWPQIASGYENMEDIDVTLKIKLEAVDSGQTDVTVEIKFDMDKKPEWTPNRVKEKNRIRVNPKQMRLDGVE